MAFPRYKSYKHSGFDWIGEIPSHWEMLKVSHHFKVLGSGTTPTAGNTIYYENGTVPWVNTKDLNDGTITDIPKSVTRLALRHFGTLKMYPKDTVLIAMYGATIGKVGILSIDACTNQACCALNSSPKHNQKFLLYWFQGNKQHIVSMGYGGGQPNISQEVIKALKISTPPLEEQDRIVAFLDEQTAVIDEAIAKKERLIALLQEQKAVLVNTAVTRGLNPDVPMKESGVEWIGRVPAHWGILRSKWLFTVRKEKARPGDIQLSATQSYGVISQDEYMRREGRRVTQITQHLEKRSHVEVDDFVISMRSFQGGLERAWESGCIRSSYVVLEPTSKINVDFFAFLFKSYDYIQALRATANFIRDGQDLNFNNFSLVDLPVIPVEEQKAIADFLTKATEDIDKANESIQREIEALNEYRAIIISEAVTGKIKVQEPGR